MPQVTIINADALEGLRQLPSETVDCIVTSPPYWGLRDYGVQNQIGLEPTLDEYLERLLAVTAELRRVLKPAGVMFWNHGDCYYNDSRGGLRPPGSGSIVVNGERYERKTTTPLLPQSDAVSLQQKCLVLQNFRLILKMMNEQGWILRNIIIWHKPNHMPSSVLDRFANAYEPIFMLVKSKEVSSDIREFIERPMPNEWRAWLAAIVDAEGTIGIRRSKRKDKHDVFAPYITVNNTDRALVEQCLQLTGLGTIKSGGRGTNFPIYRWEVTHRKAIAVIAEIYPYLIAKKEQAKVAIALQKTNKHRGNNKGTARGPKPISEAEYQEKIRLWELMKKLNQREVTHSGLPEPNLNRRSGCERYWFDLDAVREPHICPLTPEQMEKSFALRRGKYSNGQRRTAVHTGTKWSGSNPLGKNPGDVWTIPTQPFPEAHFATFPEALVERIIKAACPPYICRKCGKPRERIVERKSLERYELPPDDPRYRPARYDKKYKNNNPQRF
ncbi:MAG: hypothetical protein DRP09_16615, partial [Candidatus Thorarchaeota archaeon]